ncbi:DUF6876 family protein [Hyphomicrobium sp.]
MDRIRPLPAATERIGVTDFPLSEIKFYVTDNTVLRPSEC